MVTVVGEDVVNTSSHPRAHAILREKVEAVARLALHDGRRHEIQDPAAIVALGEESFGVAIAFPAGAPPELIERAEADMGRLLDGLIEQRARERRLARTSESTGAFPTVHDTFDGAALALCETVRAITGSPAALAIRDPADGVLSVTAVSHGADQRLAGTILPAGAAVARAVREGSPVVAAGLDDLLGTLPTDRRRRSDSGIALPVSDGRETFGAIIVLSAAVTLDDNQHAELARMIRERGPHLAHLLAREAAGRRALTDELTGLGNRRQFEQAVGSGPERSALLILDLDHFKKLNDEHGHQAGDAALRHVAGILRRALRDGDLALRLGGEEFGLWLPGAAIAQATEVAERVRLAVSGAPLIWNGHPVPITCSIGGAAVPDTVGAAANLYSAADAALYRAKSGGRDRVVMAGL